MKKLILTNSKDKLLNLAVGAGIPAGTVLTGSAGGCTGICGSCGGSCLGGLALALYLSGRVIYKRRNSNCLPAKTTAQNKT